MLRTITSIQTDQSIDWTPITIRELGRDELYFENILREHPALMLQPDSLWPDPFLVLPLDKRDIPNLRISRKKPDIVLLSGRGDLVLVEVKLSDNRELLNGSVIGQIIQYAGAIVSLTDEEFIGWVSPECRSRGDFENYIRDNWSQVTNEYRNIARTILSHRREGKLQLIILCDEAPQGLVDVIRGITAQSALNFQMHLLSVHPYQRNDSTDILLIPNELARTEIVSHTSISVSFPEEMNQPILRFSKATLDEKTDPSKSMGVARPAAQQWDIESYRIRTRELFGDRKLEIADKIIAWAREQGISIWGAQRAQAEIGFYLETADEDPFCLFTLESTEAKKAAWMWIGMVAYRQTAPFDRVEVRQRFVDMLNDGTGPSIGLEPNEANNSKSVNFDLFVKADEFLDHYLDVFEWCITQYREERNT